MPNEREWLKAQRHWLKAEERGEDDLAERMFARLVAEMPAIEASAGFVDRTVQTVWRARTRRRIVRRAALIAAGLLITIAGAGSLSELTPLAVSLVVRATVMFSHTLVWFLGSASAGVRWWRVAEQIGTAVSGAIAGPRASAGVAVMGMIALFAIYVFHRLVSEDFREDFRRQKVR
jgi:hypothetical protein